MMQHKGWEETRTFSGSLIAVIPSSETSNVMGLSLVLTDEHNLCKRMGILTRTAPETSPNQFDKTSV